IIKILQDDGRVSISSIGRMLNVSHVAVLKRLKKIERENILKFSALINPKVLELKFATIFGDVQDYDSLQLLLKTFEKCPRIVFLAPMVAGYNFIAIMVAENQDVLENVISICAIRNFKGIRRAEVYITSTPKIPKYIPFRIITERNLENTPCGMKCKTCSAYIEDKCIGCPSTKYYKEIKR
ncbi:MAG: Lrp/AsnC family transcriptional regulator, partial [Candidatus Methanomethylicia archaeon]